MVFFFLSDLQGEREPILINKLKLQILLQVVSMLASGEQNFVFEALVLTSANGALHERGSSRRLTSFFFKQTNFLKSS